MSQVQPIYTPTTHVLVRTDADQTTVPLRQLSCIISSEVKPSDRQALLNLFTRSGPETRRDRFHDALSVFPQRYLDEVLTGKHVALVARDTCHAESLEEVFRTRLRGVDSARQRRVCRLGRRRLAGARGWQPVGAGSLGPAARARHSTAIIGIMEAGNVAIRRLLARIAPHARIRLEHDMVVLSVPLADWAAEKQAV
jgi:hypothetical protein